MAIRGQLAIEEDAVERRSMGSLEVSVVGIGTNNFGARLDEPGSKAVVDAAIEAGINLFDTADIYGGTRSEEILGAALGSRRDQVLIASKFGLPSEHTAGGGHPDYVAASCEASLRRLRTDRIDLYQFHAPDPSVPLADTLAAMQRLQEQGKVVEIGCSNFDAGLLREAAGLRGEGRGFVSVQNQYSLLWREPEAEVLAACEDLGMGLLPFYPLANGLLTGKVVPGEAPPAGTRLAMMDEARASHWMGEAMLERTAGLLAYAEQQQVPLLELAFAWLLDHGAVGSVIAGASNPGQVAANARAGDRRLTVEQRAALDAITA